MHLDPVLADEFRREPFGLHSARLHELLCYMRRPDNCLNLMIVVTKPHREWTVAVAKVPDRWPELLDEERHSSIESAEWAIFLRRWRALGGCEIPDE